MACPKILIVLPAEALRRLNAYAAHKGVARSSVVRAAIDRLLISDGFTETEKQIAASCAHVPLQVSSPCHTKCQWCELDRKEWLGPCLSPMHPDRRAKRA